MRRGCEGALGAPSVSTTTSVHIWVRMAAEGIASSLPRVEAASKLLSVWDDPLASMTATAETVCLVDSAGDGDARLVAGCEDRVLRVVRGTTLQRQRDVSLPGQPTAIAALYTDERAPRIPVLAVGIGSNVFAYRCVELGRRRQVGCTRGCCDRPSHPFRRKALCTRWEKGSEREDMGKGVGRSAVREDGFRDRPSCVGNPWSLMCTDTLE